VVGDELSAPNKKKKGKKGKRQQLDIWSEPPVEKEPNRSLDPFIESARHHEAEEPEPALTGAGEEDFVPAGKKKKGKKGKRQTIHTLDDPPPEQSFAAPLETAITREILSEEPIQELTQEPSLSVPGTTRRGGH